MTQVYSLKADPSYGHWKYDFLKSKLTYCPRFSRLLELGSGEPRNHDSLLEMVSVEYRGALLYNLKLARLRGTDFNMQVPFNTGSGKKWVRIAGILHHRRWGDPDQLIGVIEDVTQQIHEERVSLSILNHELRTPLTIIRLHSQMLTAHFADSLSHNCSRLSKSIVFYTDRIIALMDEFTNVSFDNERKRKLNLSDFEIGELITRTVNDLKLVYPNIRFEYREQESVLIRADKFQLMQVLINYLTNAIKFSPANSLIRIESGRVKGELEVAVHDRGVGFKAGHEHRLFEKFYRVENSGSRHLYSKGLGLFLVKQIIEQHGGKVRAVSGENGGASFYFTIPV